MILLNFTSSEIEDFIRFLTDSIFFKVILTLIFEFFSDKITVFNASSEHSLINETTSAPLI